MFNVGTIRLVAQLGGLLELITHRTEHLFNREDIGFVAK